jgi:hypothetical protein
MTYDPEAAVFLLAFRNNGLGGTAQNSTEYFFPGGLNAADGTEGNREFYVISKHELTKLVINVSQNNVDNPSTVTVRKNGADTGLSVSYNAGETGEKNATGSVTVTQGDTVTVEVSAGGGSTGDTVTVEHGGIEAET